MKRKSAIKFLAIFALSILQACAFQVDKSIEFSRDSPDALVFAGADTSQNNEVTYLGMTFAQFDRATQRLIPGGDRFWLGDNMFDHGLRAKRIKPGDYILWHVMWQLKPVAFLSGVRIREEWVKSPDLGIGFAPSADARIGDAEIDRFSVRAGEAVYLGEYVVGVFKPKWEDRREDVAELLKTMPNVSAVPVFRPPTLRSE